MNHELNIINGRILSSGHFDPGPKVPVQSKVPIFWENEGKKTVENCEYHFSLKSWFAGQKKLQKNSDQGVVQSKDFFFFFGKSIQDSFSYPIYTQAPGLRQSHNGIH